MKKALTTFTVCALVVGAFALGNSMAEFPELNAAKNSLLEGKKHLNSAAKEFGGHRKKAVDAVDLAIKEIDQAILYGDKK